MFVFISNFIRNSLQLLRKFPKADLFFLIIQFILFVIILNSINVVAGKRLQHFKKTTRMIPNKMNTKIVVVALSLFYFIQGNNCAIPDEIVNNLNLQINDTIEEISQAIQNGSKIIHQSRHTIGLTISQAFNKIGNQLNEEINLIKQAKAEGKLVNESQCPLNLNLGLLNKCSIAKELDLLGLKLANLKRLKGNLSLNSCLSQYPLDVDGFKSCGQAKIDNARSQLKIIQNEIDKVAINAVDNANLCVAGYVESFQVTIKIAETCLEGIL